jgi:cobalt-zinc-cadmium efflux system membrane fusion protein
MQRRLSFLVIVALVAVGTVAWLNRDRWRPQLSLSAEDADNDSARTAPPPAPTSVALSDQTIKTLGLVSKPVRIGPAWRTLAVPGTVVDRPGVSDRGVSAPLTAVVVAVHAVPGDVVRPGEPLFTLRLVSELLQTTQSELFKSVEELKIVADQLERLRPLTDNGALSGTRIIDLESQNRRLAATVKSLRHDLAARGLTAEQVRAAEEGRFVTEIVVSAPAPRSGSNGTLGDQGDKLYEVQALRAELGQQVQAGQALAELADHRLLMIEGRAFKHEAALVEAAARNGWPVAVEFLATPDLEWPQAPTSLPIHMLGNNVDPVSRTFPFTLALENQFKTVKAGERSFLVWRYRPGQKVRLGVPVARLDDVVVLPPDAVARDGTERVVFRHNGNVFERRSVQVVLEERDRVAIANDGALTPGVYVVHNHATALLRAMKAQAPKPATEGGHWHADGSFHAAPKEEGE